MIGYRPLSTAKRDSGIAMGIRNRFLLAISLAGVIAASGDGALAADPADKVARVAYIGSDVASASAQTVNAFRNRLSELGWTEGRNLVLDRYWAEGRADRFPELMQTALAGKPDVLVTMGTPGALAAKKATSTVPVIVAAMGDPVQAGLVSSLSRPGGNITALSVGYADAFAGKWLELALELIPRTKSVAVIWNLGNPVVLQYQAALEQAAAAQGISLKFIDVRDAHGLDTAFRQARHSAQAAVVACEQLFIQHAQQVVDLAAANRVGRSRFLWRRPCRNVPPRRGIHR